ncbi:MAG TPA: hypothetical protein VK810_02925, partial [Dongiaceae bacterium]|nr:hypothetical protein [Dongiaceae bacterium]
MCFRWIRRALLVAVLAVLCVFVWFNQIGLPDFLKKPLVEKLHARGIQLEFSRLRLSLGRGLVAENVKIGDLKIAGSPSLTLAEIQVQLNFPALFTGRLQVDGLALHQGRLLLPLSPTNRLSLDNIQSELRFQTNDTWSLDNFKADFASAKLALSGDLAHAPEIRNWEVFHFRKTEAVGGNGAWRGRLEKIYVTLAKTRYASPPHLSVNVSGDVRDINSLAIRLTIEQAKTQLELDGGMDDVTNSFHARVHGAIEPEIIRPFLAGSKAIGGLNHFTFSEPL